MDYLKKISDQIHQEETDLDIIQDQDIDFEEDDMKFQHVDKFWTLYFNWKMKKEPWLRLHLIPDIEITGPGNKEMTNNEFSAIKKFIEEGGKILNDCSDYFKKINPNLLNLVSFMNREFVDFS